MAATQTNPRDRFALYVLQLGALAVVLAALPYKAFDLDRYFMPKELVLVVCAAVAAINCLAHLAAIGAPVVILVALTAPRGLGSIFGAVAMAAVAASLVLSRSRAAWLAVIAFSVPVALLAKLTWTRWSDPRTARRIVVL